MRLCQMYPLLLSMGKSQMVDAEMFIVLFVDSRQQQQPYIQRDLQRDLITYSRQCGV